MLIDLKRPSAWAKNLAAWSVVIAPAALIFASCAFASPHHPKGEYSQFADCPLSEKTITDCVYAVTIGGSFQIGKRSVPISNPVTIQGGFYGSGKGINFIGAEDGNTLSKAPQTVPGGLSGVTAPSWWPVWLQEWFNAGISNGQTSVAATLELAAPASAIELNTQSLIEQKGTALGLPVKIKLENALLGENCYVGSDEDPLQIDFTTGKSGDVEGAVTSPDFSKEFTISTIHGGRLVNNTFAVPGAAGCGGIYSYFFDPLVDSILGTPSAAGQNIAILEGKLQDSAAGEVKKSE